MILLIIIEAHIIHTFIGPSHKLTTGVLITMHEIRLENYQVLPLITTMSTPVFNVHSCLSLAWTNVLPRLNSLSMQKIWQRFPCKLTWKILKCELNSSI
jgi:hypothetical protein